MTPDHPMPDDGIDTRRQRRAAAREAGRTQPRRRHSVTSDARGTAIRRWAFGGLVVGVLAIGGYLAFGDFAGQRGAPSTAGTIPVQMSMAGFTPGDIHVPAGETVALELWTNDAPPHLQGGVHTMISDELGIYAELPGAGPSGESRRIVTLTTPDEPGTYDIYCDTCCGGKDSPTMHGRLVVEA